MAGLSGPLCIREGPLLTTAVGFSDSTQQDHSGNFRKYSCVLLLPAQETMINWSGWSPVLGSFEELQQMILRPQLS